MPTYEWLIEDDLNLAYTSEKMDAMRSMGVPYPEMTEEMILDSISSQAELISRNILKDIIGEDYTEEEVESLKSKEIIALIAYLQRLGSDIHKTSLPELNEND